MNIRQIVVVAVTKEIKMELPSKIYLQGKETPRFLNIACIQQVFQQGEDVYIEMTDYTEKRIVNTNIQVFMDRFI
jgi:hypothetical protein